MESTKVLVFGDSQGNFQRTFDKVTLLMKKQKFDCLLCLGNLFATDTDTALCNSFLGGEDKLPLAVYFSRGSLGLPEFIADRADRGCGEVCENLFLLNSGLPLRLAAGISIASLDEADSDFNKISSMRPALDVLLIRSQFTSPKAVDEKLLMSMVQSYMPKYQFYSSEQFCEDRPYKLQDSDNNFRLVRQIGLAPVCNADKAKWFYAFNLTNSPPDAKALGTARTLPDSQVLGLKALPSSTNTPTSSTMIKAEEKESSQMVPKKPPQGYICKLCAITDDHYFKDCPEKTYSRKRKRTLNSAQSKVVDPSSCFFCLANPNLARHLIVSIGNAGSYVVLPKGGMTQNHVIILPVDHKPTMRSMQEARSGVEAEMLAYVDALESFYESLNMVGIVFEISRATGVHFHKQMLPIPKDKISDITDAFHAFSETEGIPLESKEPEEQDEDYFSVSFPSTNETLFGRLKSGQRFDLQFGRRVISDVMGVPERAHWKDCLRTDEQETADAEFFKKSFKAFDFSL